MLHAPPREGKDIPPRARAAARLASDDLQRFIVIANALEADQDEIPVEDFAVFYAHFKRLHQKVRFAPEFAANVERINRSNQCGDDDSDHDDADFQLCHSAETFPQPTA